MKYKDVYRFSTDIPDPINITTDEEAEALLLECMQRVREGHVLFGYDIESHAMAIPNVAKGKILDWMKDTVTFWSLSHKFDDGYRRYCLECQHLHLFSPLLENPDAWLLTWNGKYDAHVSFNSGIDIRNAVLVDVMIMSCLYDDNQIRDNSLKSRAEDWCGLRMTKYKDLFGDCIDPETGRKAKEFSTSLYDLPIEKVADYASYDAYATLKVYEFLKENLELIPTSPGQLDDGRTLWDHFREVEIPMTSSLWCMERRGMGINTASLEEIRPEIQDDIENMARDINRLAKRNLNVSSPKQLSQLFFGDGENDYGLKPIKLTGTGAASTNEEVMNILAEEGYEVAQKILSYRKLVKFKSTYIDTLIEMAAHHVDGRIHPNFLQHGAVTGRFSARNPNSENMPRPDNDNFGIRKAFVARPGYVLIVSDYEQLEMRILAHFSKDKYMISAIRDGKDIHCFTVSRMHDGITYEEAAEAVAACKAGNPTSRQKELKQLRQDDKPIGFGIVYGKGPSGLAQDLDISKDDAEDKLNHYLRKAFPGVGNFIDNTRAQCAGERIDPPDDIPADHPHYCPFVRTLVGRRRRLPDIDHSNWTLRNNAKRQSVNAIIQGSASDIVKSAMLRIHFCPHLDELGVWMTNQIHDELVFEVPENNAEEALPIIKHYMENPFGDDIQLRVPLPVDIGVYGNWADAK